MRSAKRAMAASGILLCMAGAMLALFLARPVLFGLSALEVMTPSMSPGIPPGSLVYIREGTYAAGDVVAYTDPDGREVLHRIVGGDAGSGFVTKGDANRRADKLAVRPGDISGKAVLAVRGGRSVQGYAAAFAAVLCCMGISVTLAGTALPGSGRKKGDAT